MKDASHCCSPQPVGVGWGGGGWGGIEELYLNILCPGKEPAKYRSTEIEPKNGNKRSKIIVSSSAL